MYKVIELQYGPQGGETRIEKFRAKTEKECWDYMDRIKKNPSKLIQEKLNSYYVFDAGDIMCMRILYDQKQRV